MRDGVLHLRAGTVATLTVLRTVIRSAAALVVVVSCCAGALLHPRTVLVGALAFVAVRCAVAVVRRSTVAPPPPRSRPILVGVAAAAVAPAVAGASALGLPAGLFAAAAVALGVVEASVWLATDPLPRNPEPVPPSEESLRELAGALPTDLLVAEERATRPGPTTSVDDRSAGVRWRTTLIEELQRRHPDDAARWSWPGSPEPRTG